MAFKNLSKISCFFTCSCAAVPQGCCWVRVTKKGRFLCEMATAQISRNRLKAQLKLGTLTVCFRVQKYTCGCLKVQGCLCQDTAAGPAGPAGVPGRILLEQHGEGHGGGASGHLHEPVANLAPCSRLVPGLLPYHRCCCCCCCCLQAGQVKAGACIASPCHAVAPRCRLGSPC